MSDHAEDKYWTDYVRVATPIVGLLLLLGVFWYWANSLIGADSATPPPTQVVTPLPQESPTPTPTTESADPTPTVENEPAPPTEAVEPTETPDDGSTDDPPTRTPRSNDPTATAEVEPTEDSGCDQQWCEGDTIVTTSDVRMRSEPSTDADIVENLDPGVELVVISSDPEEAGGYVWWNVRDDANGIEGWVVEDWLGLPD